MKTQDLSMIMRMAWRFFRITGQAFGDCLRQAWANYKLVERMRAGIVKFYFQKVDGSVREAYGTLSEALTPKVEGEDNRKKNDTTQVYFDTECQEWRCFKKLNLI